LPAYRPDYLEEALESLLSQTFADFALVLVDDSESKGAYALAERYARTDHRITLYQNQERLGLVGNWRRAYELAMEHHPKAEFFAWGSDHDIWHPQWLARLIRALDAEPDAVLAYPLTVKIDPLGHPSGRRPRRFNTVGISSMNERVALSARKMKAGEQIYGLFRSPVLREAGIFRRVMVPDRLLLIELCLLGSFVQVDDLLWNRRVLARPTLRRQRASLFRSTPFHAYLPYSLVHTVVLALSRNSPASDLSYTEKLHLVRTFARESLALRARRWRRKLRQRLGPRRLRVLIRELVRYLARRAA